MRRYYDNAIIVDSIFVLIIGVLIFFCKPIIKNHFNVPSIETINNFSVSLITVCATLIGFYLTIITVIVTFKKGFEEKINLNKSQESGIPEKTVFETKVSKEGKFYNSNIHKNVVNVFVRATYEIAVVLLSLLLIQFNVWCLSVFWNSLFAICLFIPIVFATIRCFYIFQLFLNVHLHNKSIEENT